MKIRTNVCEVPLHRAAFLSLSGERTEKRPSRGAQSQGSGTRTPRSTLTLGRLALSAHGGWAVLREGRRGESHGPSLPPGV